MRLDPKLTAFNRRFAMAVRDVFSDDVAAEQNVNGNLCFCGPHPRDGTICTQVVIHLNDDVQAALSFATPLQRETLIRNLIENLAGQLRARYDPNVLGQSAFRVVGTMETLRDSLRR